MNHWIDESLDRWIIGFCGTSVQHCTGSTTSKFLALIFGGSFSRDGVWSPFTMVIPFSGVMQTHHSTPQKPLNTKYPSTNTLVVIMWPFCSSKDLPTCVSVRILWWYSSLSGNRLPGHCGTKEEENSRTQERSAEVSEHEQAHAHVCMYIYVCVCVHMFLSILVYMWTHVVVFRICIELCIYFYTIISCQGITSRSLFATCTCVQ